MLRLFQLDNTLSFPDPELSLDDPDGLLAFGGDLSVARLLCAYQHGIFPWFSEGEPLLWWSPSQRGILELNEFHCSRSLSKFIRKSPWRVSINQAFDDVIEHCALVPRSDNGTWITRDMIYAYQALHQAGHAHSVEVWDDEKLVGGLYGVGLPGIFCGESMFHLVTNASKVAFYYLVQHLQQNQFDFIDCQMQNPHIQQFGVKEISRSSYLQRLTLAEGQQLKIDTWHPQYLK